MKIGYILLLVFCAFFHFIMPHFFYQFYGFFSVCFPMDKMLFDQDIYNKVVMMNVLGLLLASFVIYFIPINGEILPKTRNLPSTFVLISLGTMLFFIWISGGPQGVIEGRYLGTWLSYVSLFLTTGAALNLTITHNANSNIVLILFSQVVVSLLAGSRSAPVILLSSFFIFLSSKQNKKRIATFFIAVVVSGVFSIFFFEIATKIRFFNKTEGNIKSIVSDALVSSQNMSSIVPIMGRISLIEPGMIAIITKEQGKSPDDMKLFYEKYSLLNQLSLFKNYFFPRVVKNKLNQYFPGLFKYDLPPNQYFRAMFMGSTIKEVQEKYLSINITFPVYAYMYSNFFVATALYSLLLVGGYLLVVYFSSRSSIVSIIIFSSMYNFIYFFDLTDYLVMLQRSVLTGFAFWLFYKLTEKIKWNELKAKLVDK